MKKIDIAILLLGIGIGVILTTGVFYYNPIVKYIKYSDEQIISKYKEIKLRNERDEESTTNQNKEEKKEKESVDDKQKVESKPKQLKFTINKGEPLDVIVERLLENKIIDSKESFIDRLTVRGDTQKIQYGDYDIEIPISNDELIDILINK